MNKPPLIPTLITAFFVVLMINLGLWQLNRADEKKHLLKLLANDSVTFIKTKDQIKNLPKYANIKLTGHYLNAPQLLLDNQVNNRVVGYHVFTPFKINDINLILMVNRGWINKKDFSDDFLKVDGTEYTINGKLNSTPQVGMQLGEITLDASLPNQIMTYYDENKTSVFLHQEICQQLDCVVSKKIMWLNQNQDQGFKRDWNPIIMPVSKHIGYAVQWLSMTIVLIIIFIYWVRKQHYSVTM